MEDDRLILSYPLPTPRPTESEIEVVLLENISDLTPLFERFIDDDDGRTSLIEDSPTIIDIYISPKFDNGSAEIEFESDFYAGCKDMNGTFEHEATVEFDIEDGYLEINMQLPAKWGPSDVY